MKMVEINIFRLLVNGIVSDLSHLSISRFYDEKFIFTRKVCYLGIQVQKGRQRHSDFLMAIGERTISPKPSDENLATIDQYK